MREQAWPCLTYRALCLVPMPAFIYREAVCCISICLMVEFQESGSSDVNLDLDSEVVPEARFLSFGVC